VGVPDPEIELPGACVIADCRSELDRVRVNEPDRDVPPEACLLASARSFALNVQATPASTHPVQR
jgi:hypothetical protein